MEKEAVTDLYEAAYLLLNGGRLEGVHCIPLSASVACQFTFTGAGLAEAREAYRVKAAGVNLYAFRSAYTQVNGYMREAKKNYEKEQRQERREARQ